MTEQAGGRHCTVAHRFRFLPVAVLVASVACASAPADTRTSPAQANAPLANAPADTARPGPGRPLYRGSVRIDPERGSIGGSWIIDFVADSTMRDSVVLLLNSGLRVTRVDGTPTAGYTQDEEGDVVVRFRAPLDVGRVVSLALSVEGVPVFGDDRINGIGAGWVELGLDSEWHPIFAGYDQLIAGTVEVMLPEGWESVASGTFHRSVAQRALRNDVPLIDIAFSAAPALDSATAARASVYFTDAAPGTVARILESADGCASYLNEQYGAQSPLPRAKIVLAPRPGPGYARQNYIVITDVSGFDEAGLAHFLCHELAHFWSSGANAMSADNWLNEAFAEYVAGRYIRERFGADAYAPLFARWEEAKTGTPPIWTPASTSRPGPRVAYRKAPWLLHRFEERIGATRMDAVLREYMLGRLATTPDLLAAIARVAGPDEERWFRDELAR